MPSNAAFTRCRAGPVTSNERLVRRHYMPDKPGGRQSGASRVGRLFSD